MNLIRMYAVVSCFRKAEKAQDEGSTDETDIEPPEASPSFVFCHRTSNDRSDLKSHEHDNCGEG